MPPQLARSMTSCPLRPGERAADQFFGPPMPKCNLLGRLRAAAASPVEFTNNVTKGVGPAPSRGGPMGPGGIRSPAPSRRQALIPSPGSAATPPEGVARLGRLEHANN